MLKQVSIMLQMVEVNCLIGNNLIGNNICGWGAAMCRVLEQDTKLSQHLSPHKCMNGF